MAKNDPTRKIHIYINDREVVNSLGGINKEIGKVNGQMRNLNKSSETYDQDLKKLQATLSELKNKQAEFKDEIYETGQISGEASEKISKIFMGLRTGDLNQVREGLAGIKQSIIGMTQSAIAFIATPIGAAIAVIAGLAIGTKAVFDFNVEAEKSARLIENLSGKTGQVVEDIRVKIQSLTDTFGLEFDQLAGAVDNLVDTGVAKDELEALEKIKQGLLTAPDKNEFVASLESSAVTAKQVGLDLEEVIALKKQIEETGVDPEATFGALQKAGRNLSLQTDELRKKMTDAFGASFTDEILAKVKTGEISTVQALDSISKKSKEVSLNQTEQAELGNQLFGKSSLAAGGYATVLDTVTAGLEKQKEELNENQKASEGLLEANERLNKAQSDLFRIEGFGSIWDGIKSSISNAIAGALERLNALKLGIMGIYNIVQNTFINIKNAIIASFQDIITRISPVLEALGVDIDKLQKRLEGMKSQKVVLEFDKVNNETTKKEGNDVVKLTAEELKKQQELRDAARKKEEDARNKAAEKLKSEQEKARKEEYEKAKALADAKVNLAKAQLNKYIFDLRSNLDKEKALTPEILASEKERLAKIRDAQIKFNNEELARKIADLEAKAKLEGTSMEVLNLQKEALIIEYEQKNQQIQLDYQQQTEANKKQFEEEQKQLKLEQAQLDNELALEQAATKEEEDAIKRQQDYDQRIKELKDFKAEGVITEKEYDDFIIALNRKKVENERIAQIQSVESRLNELGKLADATTALFGQNKASASATAIINGGLAVTEILKTESVLPEPLASISRGVQIAAAVVTTGKAIAQINSAKAPKRAQFYYGGDTGSNPSLGYDQFGPVTGVVHSNEWVAPATMTQSPRYAATFSWLENERKGIIKRGFVDGGETTTGTVTPFIETSTQTNDELLNVMRAVLFRLDNPIPPQLQVGYKEAEDIEKLNIERNQSSDNGRISTP